MYYVGGKEKVWEGGVCIMHAHMYMYTMYMYIVFVHLDIVHVHIHYVNIHSVTGSPSPTLTPYSHAGVDPSPAVFGVVRRVSEGTEDLSHTDQQVRGHSLLMVHEYHYVKLSPKYTCMYICWKLLSNCMY